MKTMQEFLNLRLTSEASRFFRCDEVSLVGGFCLTKLRDDDPRLETLAQAEQEEWSRSGCGVVLGWEIERNYTVGEVGTAELFRIVPVARFEPTGEECGTEYDFANICDQCGAGRIQRSELVLDLRRLPKRGGLAVSLGGEVVVCHDTAQKILSSGLTGFNLKPVRHRASKLPVSLQLESVPSGRNLLTKGEEEGLAPPDGAFYVWLNRPEQADLLAAAMSEAGVREQGHAATRPLPVWYQLLASGEPATVERETRFGINPLNDDPKGEFRCTKGHTGGLAVLSEVSVSRSSWGSHDFGVTDRFVGFHPTDSLIYPEPLLLISPKFHALLLSLKPRGIRFEVAHLLGDP